MAHASEAPAPGRSQAGIRQCVDRAGDRGRYRELHLKLNTVVTVQVVQAGLRRLSLQLLSA